MMPLFEAALELQNFFIARRWKFCLTGGIAVLRWGEPRFTRDVDVTLLTGFGREDVFIAPILYPSCGRRDLRCGAHFEQGHSGLRANERVSC
jgi:hypothetical protein